MVGTAPRVRPRVATSCRALDPATFADLGTIPEEQCRQANLGYVDLDLIDLAAAEAYGETFVVPNAGEVLFRLR